MRVFAGHLSGFRRRIFPGEEVFFKYTALIIQQLFSFCKYLSHTKPLNKTKSCKSPAAFSRRRPLCARLGHHPGDAACERLPKRKNPLRKQFSQGKCGDCIYASIASPFSGTYTCVSPCVFTKLLISSPVSKAWSRCPDALRSQARSNPSAAAFGRANRYSSLWIPDKVEALSLAVLRFAEAVPQIKPLGGLIVLMAA